MRHTHASDDARRTNAAGANADLHRVSTGFHQRQGRRAGGNIAADHIDMRIVLLDPANPVNHALAVAVGSVHHNSVHPGANQGFDTLFGALAHPDGRADAQFAIQVTRSIGKGGLLGDVLDSNQALQLKLVVDQQDAL